MFMTKRKRGPPEGLGLEYILSPVNVSVYVDFVYV